MQEHRHPKIGNTAYHHQRNSVGSFMGMLQKALGASVDGDGTDWATHL